MVGDGDPAAEDDLECDDTVSEDVDDGEYCATSVEELPLFLLSAITEGYVELCRGSSLTKPICQLQSRGSLSKIGHHLSRLPEHRQR